MGPVTIGTGGGAGAFLAPGLHGPGVLSIHEALKFNADATYQVELQSKTSSVDELVARQVVIDGSAHFAFTVLGQNTLPVGSVFTLINDTGSRPITGRFVNLTDGSIFPVKGNTFQVSYEGGDGNDLTLTVLP